MPKNLRTLLAVLSALLPTAAIAVTDTEDPTCKIKAFYTQPGPSGSTKFTFVVEAFDNVAVKRLQYRAAVGGGALGAWRNYPYVPGTRITYTVNCSAFNIQFRSVDTSSNTSPAVSQSFTAPFPRKPVPRPEPLFDKARLFTGGQDEIKDVAMTDVNGDGHADIALALFNDERIRVHIAGGALLSGTQIDLPFSDGPQALAFGRIFGPNGSAANDARPDIVTAVGTKVRILINNGQDGTNVNFSSSDVVPFILPDSTFYYAVAAGDVNGDGFDDIIAGGVYGFPTFGTVDVILNKGIEPNGAGGFRHAGFEAPVQIQTGLRIEQVLLADIDDDGDRDIVAGDNANKIVATLLNNGNGTFAAPVEQTTMLNPEAITIGDMTNDGYVDIAVFGSTSDGSTSRAGFQLLRNTADPANNFGTFVDAGGQFIFEIPVPGVFFPGDIAISDVTLDGIPEVVIANHYNDTIDIYRFAVIRDADTGEFTTFIQEGLDRLTGIDGPMKFAVGDINGDHKPDIAAGNFSTDQLAIFLNKKGNTDKTSPFSLAVELKPTIDPLGTITIPDEFIDCDLIFSNDGFNDQTDVVLTAMLPPAVEVQFTDANSDNVDDVFGFTRTTTRSGRTLAVNWNIGALEISQAGRRSMRLVVRDTNRIGAKLSITGSIRGSEGKKTAKSRTIQVTSTVTIAAETPQMTVFPGGLAEFRLRVKNRAGYAALGVTVTAPVPANCGLRTTSPAPGFINADGDLIPRVDPTTGRTVVPPKRAPFLNAGGSLLNPGIPADRRSLTWYIGTMLPDEEVLLRFYVRLAYDFDTSNPAALVLGKVTGDQKATGPLGSIEQFGSAPQMNIVPPVGPVAQPKVSLYVRAEGAGRSIDETDGTPLTLVSTKPVLLPDAEPALKANQLRFIVTYANSGDALAESLRVYLLVPPGTIIDRKSVVIGDETGLNPVPPSQVRITSLQSGADVPEVDDELADGGFLALDVPFLEANFPSAAGSAKTVRYTVTLQSQPRRLAPSIGDRIGMFGVIQSDMFIGLPFLNAIALSDPLVTYAQVVEPVMLTPEHADAVLASGTDNRLLSAQAFYTNTGGVTAEQVVAVVSIPQGATYENGSAQLLNASGVSVLAGSPVVNLAAGTVTLPLGSYVPGQRPGSLKAGSSTEPAQRLQIKIDYRTTNANVPVADSATPRSGIVPPLFSLYHAGDPPPASTAARERSTVTRDEGGVRSGSQTEVAAYVRDPSDPVWFYGVDAPGCAAPGDEITFILFFGNTSNNSGIATIVFPVPSQTVPVRFNIFQPPGQTVGGGFVDPGVLSAYPNGFFSTGFGDSPHSASGATVTVRVVDNPTANEIVATRAFAGAKRGGYIFLNPLKIPIVGPTTDRNTCRDSIVRAAVGGGAATAIGTINLFNPANIEFANDVKRITDTSRIRKIAGAGYLDLKAGVVIIPLGGGNIVAAGGGNIVANDGAGIVANDGAGIVAAGGGNLIGLTGIVANLSQTNLYNLVATAAKAQNTNLLPGASIVAGGGGNIVAGGGGNLIGHDGATLVGQDGAGLRAIVDNDSLTGAAVMISGSPVLVNAQFEFSPALLEKAAKLGGNFNIGLFEQAGSGVITFGDGVITEGSVGQPSSDQLAGAVGNLIGQDARNIVAAGGGNIVAGGGGNIVANDGAGAPRESASRPKR